MQTRFIPLKKCSRNEHNGFSKKRGNSSCLIKIQNIDKLYLGTVLTPKEKKYFKIFVTYSTAINSATQNENWNQVRNNRTYALQTLEQLSKIQSEGCKSKLTHSNSIYNGNKVLEKLQIALLIILGGITLYITFQEKQGTY